MEEEMAARSEEMGLRGTRTRGYAAQGIHRRLIRRNLNAIRN